MGQGPEGSEGNLESPGRAGLQLVASETSLRRQWDQSAEGQLGAGSSGRGCGAGRLRKTDPQDDVAVDSVREGESRMLTGGAHGRLS